ncbi:unnamed protein product [Phyllotreta striolata]|uniref:YLP motif-containing protein 1 n=1 Tax=Phyllotreta striolata TaxID=444603 RepID=A0A9N9TSN3_PHYSR|nr:unnamed protein product [Phyllotreta striolata]
MSWPTWSTAGAPIPAPLAAPVQSTLLPVNSAPAVMAPLGSYSQEQWAQVQQQNWQQWAQWQQQYQQWHQQYGAEYQKSLSALQSNIPNVGGVQPPLPTPLSASMVPPLPVVETNNKPPLPPDEPPHHLNFSSQANVHQMGYSTAPLLAQHSVPPPQVVQSAVHHQNWQSAAQKRPSAQDSGGEKPKRLMLEKTSSQWTQPKQPWENNSSYNQPPPLVPAKAAANVEELSEAEKKFDKEFAAWEAQFNKWKEQNANHPDKIQYKEYEKKWESWRNSLLERREQMRRRRLGLVGQKSPNTSTVTAVNSTGKSSLLGQYPGSVQASQSGEFGKITNESVVFKTDEDANPGESFLKSSSTGGIPGLDLVKEGTNDENLPDRSVETKSEKNPTEQSHKGPDFDAISKGINSILGDRKLLSMLSLVTQNASYPSANSVPNFSVPPPNLHQLPPRSEPSNEPPIKDYPRQNYRDAKGENFYDSHDFNRANNNFKREELPRPNDNFDRRAGFDGDQFDKNNFQGDGDYDGDDYGGNEAFAGDFGNRKPEYEQPYDDFDGYNEQEEDYDRYNDMFNEKEDQYRPANVQQQRKIPSLMDQIAPAPPHITQTEEPDEPLFEPTTVIDYGHKSKKKSVNEVFVVPLNMFDYNHKPLNRVPLHHRPKWLKEATKFIREFDPAAVRYERIPPPAPLEDRYSRLDERPYERGIRDELYYNRRADKSRPDFGDSHFHRREEKKDKFKEVYAEKRHSDNHKTDPVVTFNKDDFEDFSDTEMDFEHNEQARHHYDGDATRSKSKSPELSNPPNPSNHPVDTTTIEEILNPPGRYNRPPRIVIILRGPPGSGKTFLAKQIKDKEVENGGSAPRILSLDDYFLVEQEKKIVEDGKAQIVKEMVYEYEADMEESYRMSFMKSFKKTITDGYFPFIIVDNVNDKVKHFGEMWSFAKQNGFQVYLCQMDLDPVQCAKRNIHNRTEGEIEEIISNWEPTPSHHPTIDASGLLQTFNAIADVEMEIVEQSQDVLNEPSDPEDQVRSKWDNFDCSSNNLAKLDGVSKPLRKSRTMEEYLQLEKEWEPPKSSTPGKKRVRWADLEEQRHLEKMRAIGFVVGQTDWDRMMDPTGGRSALTQTKYIENVSRYRHI